MEICQSVAEIKTEGAKNADGHGAYNGNVPFSVV